MTIKSGYSRAYITIILMLLFSSYSELALPAIERKIKIVSTPKGADVFLLKGNKKTHLGKTPITPSIKFHSALSQIRLLFEKQGFNPVTLIVKASDVEIIADLNRHLYLQNPEFHKNPYLRRLQSRINRDIEPLLKDIIQSKKNGFILSSPAVLTGSKGNISLIVSLEDNTMIPSHQSGQSKALQQLWSRLVRWIMLPLAKHISTVKEVETLSVRLVQNIKQNKLTVKPTTETKTVMQCMPGYRSQQVLRFKQVPQYESYTDKYGYHTRLTGFKLESYLDTEQVYEPCHNKVPVTQVAPTTKSNLEHARSIHIEFSMKLADYKLGMSNEQAYKTLSIIQTTSGERRDLKTPSSLNYKP